MPCREGKLSGGAFFIALDINHWFGDPILILVDIPIGKPDFLSVGGGGGGCVGKVLAVGKRYNKQMAG